MRTIINYIHIWTEPFRQWLAYVIFPEISFYMEAIKRMAKIDENLRCIEALGSAESTCSEWAIETIRIKLASLEDIMSKFDDMDEPPF